MTFPFQLRWISEDMAAILDPGVNCCHRCRFDTIIVNDNIPGQIL